MKHWGDKKDYLHCIKKFGALTRKTNESVDEFTKIFSKMYNKIPTDINHDIGC